MPNRDEHIKTGAWVGGLVAGATNFIEQTNKRRLNPNYQFDIGEFASIALTGCGVGALGGMLPDVLEPATHPGHRDFCHSLAAGALVVMGAKKVNDNPAISPGVKLVVNTAAVGYASHLWMDGQTPAGLPLLGRR